MRTATQFHMGANAAPRSQNRPLSKVTVYRAMSNHNSPDPPCGQRCCLGEADGQARMTYVKQIKGLRKTVQF